MVQSLKKMTEELIDKRQLSANEYKNIYHQNVFLIDSGDAGEIEQSFVNASKGSSQSNFAINIMQSENILLQKQTEEQLSQNKILKSEMDDLKKSMAQFMQESTRFKKFEETVASKIKQIMEEAESRDIENNNRINKLEQKLQDMEQQLAAKNQELDHYKSQNTTIAYKTAPGQHNFYNPNKNQPQQRPNTSIPQYGGGLESNPFLNQTAESVYVIQNRNASGQNQFSPAQQQQFIQQQDSAYVQNPFENNNIITESPILPDSGQNFTEKVKNVEKRSLGKVTFTKCPETLEQSDYHLLAKFLEVYSPQNIKLELIYRGSEDGYTPQDFHDKCDGHEKTIVLIKSWEHDKVFGGYVSAKWEDCGEYLVDNDAFIFSIDNQTKFKPRKPEFSVFLGQDYMLCFGNDIMIGENCNIDENSVCQFPRDYICDEVIDDREKTTYLTGAPQFQVDDIEVYKVNINEY